MSKICLFTAGFLIFLIPALSFALEQSALPNPSGGHGSDRTVPSPVPNRSEGLDNQANTPSQPPHFLGIDSQGNTAVLTPNQSGGYTGVDSRGGPMTITPLRGNLGVDSQGNIWTITPR
jgi:hypothetical protein